MNWVTDWNALCSRLQGLIDAGSLFFVASHSSRADDLQTRKKVLLKHAESIFAQLRIFRRNYNSVLPIEAFQCLDYFLNSKEVNELDFEPVDSWVRANVQFALTSLAAFKSEFSYLIADTQATTRRLTERAFIHLQRSIVVDKVLRENWNSAFQEPG